MLRILAVERTFTRGIVHMQGNSLCELTPQVSHLERHPHIERVRTAHVHLCQGYRTHVVQTDATSRFSVANRKHIVIHSTPITRIVSLCANKLYTRHSVEVPERLGLVTVVVEPFGS